MYCNALPEDEISCLLVVMGADPFGNKELPAVSDGFRESPQSWKQLLLDLRSRGLQKSPVLAVCNGAMGFQAACMEARPETRIRRCWLHKSGNLLYKLPASIRAKAKVMLHILYQARTRQEALKAH